MNIYPEEYTQWYVGDTGTPLVVVFLTSNFSAYILQGIDTSEMTFRIHNRLSGTTRSGTGAWEITDSAHGIAEYHWDSLDVNTKGVYDIQTTIPFAEGPITFRPIVLELVARL